MARLTLWSASPVMAFLVLLVLLRGPAFLPQGLMNAGLLQYARASACPLTAADCQSDSPPLGPLARPIKEGHLDEAQALLEAAQRVSPNSDILHLHLASVYFAQGERWKALDVLPAAASFPPARSPLMSKSRYERLLIQARSEMRSEEWGAAVRDFHQAMVLEPERILDVDDSDLFQALAGQQRQRVIADPADSRARYLTGKYLARADLWNEASIWLREALDPVQDSRLSEAEIGRASMYLGRALLLEADQDAARSAFEKAIAVSPDLREAYVDQIELLRRQGRQTEASKVESQLTALGPTFRLGTDGPAVLPDGWKLIGYDVDEQLMEVSPSIDLVLWWQAPASIRAHDQMTRVGDYVLQRQTVQNLFANAGFEWGVDSRGIPLGQDREYYGAPAGSLRVEEATRRNVLTHVLAAYDGPTTDQVALASRIIPVDAASYYLMAGWLWEHNGSADILRNCHGVRLPEGGVYYLSTNQGQRPPRTWVHIATLATPLPDRYPDTCEVLAYNSPAGSKAMWDSILWVRLSIP